MIPNCFCNFGWFIDIKLLLYYHPIYWYQIVFVISTDLLTPIFFNLRWFIDSNFFFVISCDLLIPFLSTITHLTLGTAYFCIHGFPWNLMFWILWTSVVEIYAWLKSGKNIWQFTWRPKYVVLLLATLQRHNSAVSECLISGC